MRNELSVLEDGGYIVQPHTSAGRVPTQKGYRLFVDEVARIKPLSAPERAAITVMDEYRGGKLGRLTFEAPPEE